MGTALSRWYKNARSYQKTSSSYPANTLDIRLADFFDAIRSTVEERLPLEQVTRVNISRRVVYFQDGMRWYVGTYEVPDPNHPGYYTQLASGYFPGNALQYLAGE